MKRMVLLIRLSPWNKEESLGTQSNLSGQMSILIMLSLISEVGPVDPTYEVAT